MDDSARLVHADSESELGCCKVLGANGGSETITDAGDYCIRGVCALRVQLCGVVATDVFARAYTVGS